MATLEVDKAGAKTMLDQATRGYLNAIDIADYLAAEKGLSFRAAHGVVREAVEACRSDKSPALTAKALNTALEKAGKPGQLSDAEVSSLSDPAQNLKHRKNMGSPNPKDLERQISSLSDRLGEQIILWQSRREKIENARKKLFA